MTTHYKQVVAPEKGEFAILIAANANFVQVRQGDSVIIFTPDLAEEVSKEIMLAAAAMLRAKESLLPPRLPFLEADEFFPEAESLSADASQQPTPQASPVSGDAGIPQESHE